MRRAMGWAAAAEKCGAGEMTLRDVMKELMKPGRETIYTRVDRQWRYKAGAAIDTAFHRGGEISFAWMYKALSVFGSQVVFGVGLAVAGVMTVSAWRLLREERKLPPERTHVETP